MSRTSTRSRSVSTDPGRRRGPGVRRVATAAAVVACMGASALPAHADGPSATGESRGIEIPAFYDPPAELPSADGELVRTEPLPLGLSIPGLDGREMPGEATRLMYKSTDSHGEPVAVSGAYIEPSAEWKGEGPRPLVAVGSGTMGQGDQCAPSFALEHPLTLNGETMSVAYEDLAIYRLLAKGAAVVVTDYAGLGSTDRLHTYVNRVDEGHAVLDAVRAARAVPGASVTPESKTALYGYSQGGGATASAAELQSTYAPDVELAGTYAGAPPADLVETMKGIDGSALAAALGWSINGFAQSEPELKKVIDDNVNDEGRAGLKDMSTMCTGDGILGYGFASSTEWIKGGTSLPELIDENEKARAVLDDQRIGRLEPSGPVRVATGSQDDIVPHGQSRQLAADWCSKGADVTFKSVELPNLGDKLLTNHVTPLLVDQGEAIGWLTDRLSGKETESNCSAVETQG